MHLDSMHERWWGSREEGSVSEVMKTSVERVEIGCTLDVWSDFSGRSEHCEFLYVW